MEQSDIQINHNLSITSTKILLFCPYCTKLIPDILLKPIEGRMNVQIKCPCLIENKEIDIREFINIQKILPVKDSIKCLEHQEKGTKFCMNCSLWYCNICASNHFTINSEHKALDQEIILICKEHHQKYKSHCIQCNQSLCSECLSNGNNNIHQKHQVHPIKDIDMNKFQQDYAKISKMIKCYEEQKDMFIDTIDPYIDSIKKRLDYLLKLKIEVELAYSINMSINTSLRDLYKSVSITAFTTRLYPNYNIIKLFQSLSLNHPKYIPMNNTNTLEELSEQLKNFYNDNYILKQIINEKEEIKKEKCLLNCKATFTEYTSIVSALVELKNGDLASAFEKEIKLWHIKDEQCYANLIDHADTVECLLLLSDDILVSGSYDKTIKLWDTTALKIKETLIGHTNCVTCLIQLKEKEIHLASSSDDQTIKLWNLLKKTCLFTFTGHNGIIFSLILLNGGNMASASEDHTIKIWNQKNMFSKCSETYTGHSGIVFCLLQLSNQYIASGSSDNTIKIWNLKGKCKVTLEGHKRDVRVIDKLNDGRFISGSSDSAIKIWDGANYNCLGTIYGHCDTVKSIIQFKNGLIVSGSWDMTIKVWSLQ